jgi:hypothetical protein
METTRRFAMRRIALAISLLICLCVTVHSQEQAPQLLTRAAHCLAVKDFLPSSRTKRLSFGYDLDEKSYPGEKVLYLVQYAAPARSNVLVFAIYLTEHDGRQNFNIQNNGSFAQSKDAGWRRAKLCGWSLDGTQTRASILKRDESWR